MFISQTVLFFKSVEKKKCLQFHLCFVRFQNGLDGASRVGFVLFFLNILYVMIYLYSLIVKPYVLLFPMVVVCLLKCHYTFVLFQNKCGQDGRLFV